MSYTLINLVDLTELKNRRGNTTNTTLATILGLNYPTVEAFSVYVWDNLSVEACDDNEIVCPLLGVTGRWYKVDLDQIPQQNADWTSTSGASEILNKPALAVVATTGSYNDLGSKPTIPPTQISSDWTSSTPPSEILNKPSLSTVATSGAYADLTGKPTIPTAQLSSDWNSSVSPTQVLNKPALSTVATTGSYNDLMSKPTIPSSQVNSDWTSVSGVSQVLNKPSLATVATSGSYTDLTSKPTIPAAQVQTDWNAITGIGVLLNKPTIPTVPANVSAFTNDSGYLTTITSGQVIGALGFTPYNSSNPNSYISSITSSNVTTALGYTPVTNARTIIINGTAFDLSVNRTWSVGDLLSTGTYPNPTWLSSLAWSKLTGTPTTLSGYGITDGVTSSALTVALSSYATTSALTSGLAGKQNTISLTTTGTGAATLVGASINVPTPTIPSQFNPTAGTGISVTGTYPNNTITNTSPDQTVSLTAGTNIGITGTYPSFTISESLNPTINNAVSRTLGTNFTISTTRLSMVYYTVTCSATNPLLAGSSSSSSSLQYSTNAGSTWITVSTCTNLSSVALAVAVAITQQQTTVLAGTIPANALVRITSTVTGTGSVTYVYGQEVIF